MYECQFPDEAIPYFLARTPQLKFSLFTFLTDFFHIIIIQNFWYTLASFLENIHGCIIFCVYIS